MSRTASRRGRVGLRRTDQAQATQSSHWPPHSADLIGFAVEAEIKTAERRVVQYLLSPITRTVDEAGHEKVIGLSLNDMFVLDQYCPVHVDQKGNSHQGRRL